MLRKTALLPHLSQCLPEVPWHCVDGILSLGGGGDLLARLLGYSKCHLYILKIWTRLASLVNASRVNRVCSQERKSRQGTADGRAGSLSQRTKTTVVGSRDKQATEIPSV